ncbi:MAG: hypothetical protein GY755_15785, partial [Chloroflexi bacterium]|nr:hypothetical protein [Chloroflexota bacterium]
QWDGHRGHGGQSRKWSAAKKMVRHAPPMLRFEKPFSEHIFLTSTHFADTFSYKMAKNGQKWQKNGQKWPKMTKNGQKWPKS